MTASKLRSITAAIPALASTEVWVRLPDGEIVRVDGYEYEKGEKKDEQTPAPWRIVLTTAETA